LQVNIMGHTWSSFSSTVKAHLGLPAQPISLLEEDRIKG